MDKSTKKRNDKIYTPVFDTLAVLDAKHKTHETNVIIPPENSTKEAKDWVDHNEK